MGSRGGASFKAMASADIGPETWGGNALFRSGFRQVPRIAQFQGIRCGARLLAGRGFRP